MDKSGRRPVGARYHQEQLCVTRRAIRQQRAPRAPTPSCGHTCGSLPALGHLSFPAVGTDGKVLELRASWSEACALYSPSRRLLKDALCGPQMVLACVSPGEGREKAKPAVAREASKETANSGPVAPVHLSKQGVRHFLKNPAVPWKSAEWPFCAAPNVLGALPSFLTRYKRWILWAAAWASGLRTGRGASKDTASVPRDRLTRGVTLGRLLNLFTP